MEKSSTIHNPEFAAFKIFSEMKERPRKVQSTRQTEDARIRQFDTVLSTMFSRANFTVDKMPSKK